MTPNGISPSWLKCSAREGEAPRGTIDLPAFCWIALIVVNVCSGCVSTDRYPESWSPRILADAECPDISGTYGNVGRGSGDILFCPDCAEGSDYHQCAEQCTDDLLQLSEVFFEATLAVESNVGITQMRDSKIEAWVENQDLAEDFRSLSRDEGDFACNEGQIWLPLDRDLEVDLGGIAVSSKTLGLMKAADGSLIGEFRYKGTGVIFVAIPSGWSETHFIRWPSIESGKSELIENGN